MPTTRSTLGAVVSAAILSLAGAGAADAASQTTHSTAALSAKLSRLMTAAGPHTSGLVLDTTTGQTLFSRGANTGRLPASDEKLYTTSAGLLQFGPDYRFQTDVYGAGSVSNGTFSGTLYIKGGGDPTLGASGMRALARNLHSAGINTVKGRVLGDASIFDKLGGGPDSHYKASTETEGELSGLVYNSGFTGRSLQSNPAKSAAGAFVALAKSGGVTIAHGTTVGTGTTPANTTQLAHVYSPTLGTLIRSTNVPSNNFYAETLLKDIGHFYGTGGSTAAGAKATLSIVKSRLGVTGVQTNDGSGLSRYDRTSPAQLVTLLDEMAADPYFVGSLPVAGVSGTLKSEMRGTPAAGDCRAKTGTLRDVANLSGYCRAANGHNLVFSFMENSLHNSNTGHALEDTMAEALAEYTGDGKGSAASPMPVPTPSFAPVTSTATP